MSNGKAQKKVSSKSAAAEKQVATAVGLSEAPYVQVRVLDWGAGEVPSSDIAETTVFNYSKKQLVEELGLAKSELDDKEAIQDAIANHLEDQYGYYPEVMRMREVTEDDDDEEDVEPDVEVSYDTETDEDTEDEGDYTSHGFAVVAQEDIDTPLEDDAYPSEEDIPYDMLDELEVFGSDEEDAAFREAMKDIQDDDEFGDLYEPEWDALEPSELH